MIPKATREFHRHMVMVGHTPDGSTLFETTNPWSQVAVALRDQRLQVVPFDDFGTGIGRSMYTLSWSLRLDLWDPSTPRGGIKSDRLFGYVLVYGVAVDQALALAWQKHRQGCGAPGYAEALMLGFNPDGPLAVERR